MKKSLIIIAGVALCAIGVQADGDVSTNSGPANAATSNGGGSSMAHKFSAGVIVGEPTGGSLKYWFSDTMAIDGALGYSFHDNSDFYLHSDVLWHNFNLIPVSRGELPVYFGVGGLVRFRSGGDDNQVGIRVPVGLSYIFDNAPVEVFAEVGPALDVSPNVRGEVTGGVGIRYRF